MTPIVGTGFPGQPTEDGAAELQDPCPLTDQQIVVAYSLCRWMFVRKCFVSVVTFKRDTHVWLKRVPAKTHFHRHTSQGGSHRHWESNRMVATAWFDDDAWRERHEDKEAKRQRDKENVDETKMKTQR